ncbi:hypothetical protein HK099_007905 [Clydaea vesicula]|uniref:Uncharacterized protein n=1 Tax=Clydaea vesicula TaxID=447962 RepID=A0AAD5U582_9FUNG|nr:hypothetical protein HK099_007905 [Clydaea vesicula]
MSTINWESESTRKDNMNIHFFPIFATFGLNGPFKALLNKFDTVTPNEDWKSYDLILNPFITAVVNNHFNIIKLLVFANKLTEYSYRWSIRIACRENNWKIFRFTMLYSSIQRKVPLLYKYDIKYLRYRLLTQAEIPRSYEIVLAARDGAYNAVKLLLSVEEIDPLVTHFGMGAINTKINNVTFLSLSQESYDFV